MVLDDGTIIIPGVGLDSGAWLQRWDGQAWTVAPISPGTKVKVYEPLELQRTGQIDLFYLGDPAGNLLHSWSTDNGATWSAFQDLGGGFLVIGGVTNLPHLVAAIVAALPAGGTLPTGFTATVSGKLA